MLTAELKPGGGSIPVTQENRQEYVKLYTHYILNDSIHQQFNVFKEGFLQVCLSDTPSFAVVLYVNRWWWVTL